MSIDGAVLRYTNTFRYMVTSSTDRARGIGEQIGAAMDRGSPATEIARLPPVHSYHFLGGCQEENTLTACWLSGLRFSMPP